MENSIHEDLHKNVKENRTIRVLANAVNTTKHFINIGEIDKAKDFVKKAIEHWELDGNTGAVIQFKDLLKEERKKLESENIELF